MSDETPDHDDADRCAKLILKDAFPNSTGNKRLHNLAASHGELHCLWAVADMLKLDDADIDNVRLREELAASQAECAELESKLDESTSLLAKACSELARIMAQTMPPESPVRLASEPEGDRTFLERVSDGLAKASDQLGAAPSGDADE